MRDYAPPRRPSVTRTERAAWPSTTIAFSTLRPGVTSLEYANES
jgi:hypothetical protein